MLHAEGELCKFAYALVGLARVAEVEIAKNLVHIRAWLRVFNVVTVIGTCRAVDVDAAHVFRKLEVVLRCICPCTYAVL